MPTPQNFDNGFYGGGGGGNNRPPRESRAADKWIADDATNTILVKGLPFQVDDKDVSVLM